MSTALDSFKSRETRTGQSKAGVLATLTYNEIIKDVLPPIVGELEGKIAELQRKIDHILDEMQWHLNSISRGIAHPELQAAATTFADAKGGRRTRRRARV